MFAKKHGSGCSNLSSVNWLLCFLIAITCILTFLYIYPSQNILIDPPISTTTTPLKPKIEHFSDKTTTQILESDESHTIPDEDGDEDDDDANQIGDILSSPPKGSSQRRIEWLMENLPKSKILESTKKTRKCDSRIKEFLGIKPDGQKSTKCKVSIFMIWISSTKLLPKRDMFALESALKTNPQGCVVLLSKIMDSKQGRQMLDPLTSRGFSVRAVAPDIHQLLKDTPAQQWLERFESGDIDPGVIPIPVNLADLLKSVMLYKYGGVYLDTDVIILKDLSTLRNSIAAQTVVYKAGVPRLNNAAVIFDKGHPLVYKFIEEYANDFRGHKWGYMGPNLVTRVIDRVSADQDKSYKFTILSTLSFYPVDWIEMKKFYSLPQNETDARWIKRRLNQIHAESYGIHLWNAITSVLKIEKGSTIGKLISDHCIICEGVYDL